VDIVSSAEGAEQPIFTRYDAGQHELYVLVIGDDELASWRATKWRLDSGGRF